MFGNDTLKEKTERLERKVDALEMALWKIENPPKYKIGEKVGKAKVTNISCYANRCMGIVYSYEYKYTIE
jgi:hypothetical protein